MKASLSVGKSKKLYSEMSNRLATTQYIARFLQYKCIAKLERNV